MGDMIGKYKHIALGLNYRIQILKYFIEFLMIIRLLFLDRGKDRKKGLLRKI
jgi:hypothetical protein